MVFFSNAIAITRGSGRKTTYVGLSGVSESNSRERKMSRFIVLAVAGLMALPAFAQNAGLSAKQTDTMRSLLVKYEAKAKEEAKDKKGKVIGPVAAFTAEAGREFYLKRRTWNAKDYTCSGCHTTDPKSEGKHIESKKAIAPLAPAVNPERFVDVAKVEKNFSEHCADLYDRDCRAEEKGNFVSYLMSVK